MATYPYSRAKEIGWAYGEILTSAQMSTVDDNAASGADGSLWTDYAVAQNWLGSESALTDYGLVLHWSDYSKSFASYGVVGGNPSVKGKKVTDTEFSGATSLVNGAGLTPLCAAESSTVRLVGGTPGSASTQKLRRSTSGGAWALETTNASSTEGVRGLCWHSGAALFIAGLDSTANTNIETSPDGETWTQQPVLANTNPRGSIASNGTTAVVMPYNTSTDKCISTTDGLNYTERTLPATATWYNVHWDSVNEVFIAFNDSQGVAYSSDGETWAAATGTTSSAYQVSAIMGRVIIGANTGGGSLYVGQLSGSTFDDVLLREITSGPTIVQVGAANSGIKQIMFSDSDDNHYWTIVGGSLFL